MGRLEIENKIKKMQNDYDKKDIIIYDDTHENGNQSIWVYQDNKPLFKINRPQMNRLKKLGYKGKRRNLK